MVQTTRTHHKRVAHFLIEGGGEELYHVSQSQEEGGVEVTVVPQHHQQWTKGTVDQLYVSLTVVSHELQGKQEYRKV